MELFWYDIRQLEPSACDSAVAQMSKARRAAIDALPEDDRRRTVAAEMLARRVIAEKCGTSAVTVTDDGKLTVEGHPLYVSTDFSGVWTVCAVDTHPVGVSVEAVRTAQEKFIRRMCSEQELAYIRYGDAGCFHRFWECWTAKNALFQLTGQGPLLGLSRFALPDRIALTLQYGNNCAITVATRL